MNKKIIITALFLIPFLSCLAQKEGHVQITKKENDTLYVVENGNKFVVDRTIIMVKPKEDFNQLYKSYTIIHTSKYGYLYFKVPTDVDVEEFAESLKKTNKFDLVEYITECKMYFESNDPLNTYQWYIDKINLKNAWDITTGNPNIRMAVADVGGIDRDHEDLGITPSSNYTNVSYSLGYDYINNVQYSTPTAYHGTYVARIAGAKTNNGLYGCGIAGGNNSSGITLISYNVSNALNLKLAIERAVSEGARIINLSIGLLYNSDVDAAITDAYNHNVSIVCASGNEGHNYLSFPASHNFSISVGASKSSDYKTDSSNYGSGLDLVAPGQNICIKANSDTISYIGGTSLAAPMVSGTIALMLSVNPNLTPDEIRTILHNSATKVSTYNYDNNGWNYYVGYGLLNTYLAVQLARFNIVGPNYINDEETYEVENLPNGFTVEWSLSDSYYNQNCLEQDEPYTNQCTITCSSSHIMINETLTANVKLNGVTVRTLTKNIYAYNDFQGHYTSGSLSGDINYTHIFYVRANTTTYITSPMLIGAVASFSSSGAIPSYWSFSPTNGNITMVTNNTSIPVVINIDDVCGNHYVLYAFASSQYCMNVSNDNNEITVTLNENGDFQRDMTYDLLWNIEVHNAETGEQKATLSSTNRSESISTAGWQKGVYIVKVAIGKEELTEKVIVR